MKQLNDSDIANMIGTEFVPENNAVKKSVRKELHLSTRIPKEEPPIPAHTIIDFHHHTEEESWNMLVQVAASGTRSATVITGASGVLKTKFQQWMKGSIITPRIMSYTQINNGSFEVKFYKIK